LPLCGCLARVPFWFNPAQNMAFCRVARACW
jgi:hypothetical protein